jgi:hypothetical protein
LIAIANSGSRYRFLSRWRRLGDQFLERAAERRFRFVADSVGNGGYLPAVEEQARRAR